MNRIMFSGDSEMANKIINDNVKPTLINYINNNIKDTQNSINRRKKELEELESYLTTDKKQELTTNFLMSKIVMIKDLIEFSEEELVKYETMLKEQN